MHEATRLLHWDMGHRVPLHGGKCRTPHGHRYIAEITCRGGLGREGFVVDFGVVKERVGAWIDHALDHTTAYQAGDELLEAMAVLNMRAGLKPFFAMETAPTAENLAELIGRRAAALLPEFEVVRVIVWETPNCAGTWAP